ncbi:YCF48-related protein [Mucilaginibacter sp. UR6-11]|uniref:WD40/YVTN/BNR-like repeat-containing protein n=1 Tax=Mucilaginibacter sp. UR6-11 TaxID=1435644 RepID=UPI001E5C41CE|nr:YCF48-related protein [Mucilaginibacter sp. UR6-11]MCC8427217.1 YCF48-related protein [Mucilaginibacter sp. UR6-11]
MHKITNKILLLTILSTVLFASTARAQHIEVLQQNKPTSIRGLSVVDDNTAWISGSKGHIANTVDGGKTWNWQQVTGFEKSDFRDIEAFSDKEAIIISSGTPALILKTIDGGAHWKVNYHNTDSTYFLDAMDFDSPKHGFVMGDPINGKFFLMETTDGGNNWRIYNSAKAIQNQAAFAASGTCLVINKLFAVVTGGSLADLVTLQKKGSRWTRHRLPIIHGKNTQGAFSIAVGKNQLIVVGGDYQKDKRQDSTACYSTNKGLTWHLSNTFPSGYQSCVTFIKNNIFLSTGTPGTNITINGGKNWIKINNESYNVCSKAKHGKLTLLAGDDGKIGILKF